MTLIFIPSTTFWHVGATGTSHFQRENCFQRLNMPKLFLTSVAYYFLHVTCNISITGAVFSVFDKQKCKNHVSLIYGCTNNFLVTSFLLRMLWTSCSFLLEPWPCSNFRFLPFLFCNGSLSYKVRKTGEEAHRFLI